MRRGLFYNYLLLFLVMIIFAEMYIALHDRRTAVLTPTPPLGTHAQEIFNAYDQGELVQLSFAQAAQDAYCQSYPFLGGSIQNRLALPDTITPENLLEDVQGIMTNALDRSLKSFPYYERAPFIVYPGTDRTDVIATKPWIVTRAAPQGTISVAVRPDATIHSSLRLGEIAKTIADVRSLDEAMSSNGACRASRSTLQDCVSGHIIELSKKYANDWLRIDPAQFGGATTVGTSQMVSFVVPVHIKGPSGCLQGFTLQVPFRIPVGASS